MTKQQRGVTGWLRKTWRKLFGRGGTLDVTAPLRSKSEKKYTHHKKGS